MDLGSVIVGAILLAICMVPFVIAYYNRVKKEDKMLQSLKNIVQQHNCNLTKYEFCGDFVLGLDENKNGIFFFKQQKEKAVCQFVDLAKIQICQVQKSTRVLKNKNNNLIIKRVELCFLPKNKVKKEAKFELYDEEINMQLSGELEFADKWSKKINECLKKK